MVADDPTYPIPAPPPRPQYQPDHFGSCRPGDTLCAICGRVMPPSRGLWARLRDAARALIEPPTFRFGPTARPYRSGNYNPPPAGECNIHGDGMAACPECGGKGER